MKTLEPWVHLDHYRFGASTGAKGSDDQQERGNAYHRKVYRLLQMHCAVSLPGWRLLVEPWFKGKVSQRLRSPDSVLIDDAASVGIVAEVKLNWRDGRDTKLLDEYLGIVKSAFGLEKVRPLLITRNLRGYQHDPLLGLRHLDRCLDWHPGKPTPLMLLLNER